MTAMLVAGAVLATTGTAQAAPALATTSAPAAAVAPAPVSDPETETMTRQDWTALKAGLNSSSDFTRQVVVAGGVRTMTYTHTGGSQLELREPVGKVSEVSPELSVGGCGFLQVCVYFNRTDQGAILAGAAAAIAAAICLVASPAGCIVASAAVAIAFYYLTENGRCPSRLRVRLLPSPGGARCVA